MSRTQFQEQGQAIELEKSSDRLIDTKTQHNSVVWRVRKSVSEIVTRLGNPELYQIKLAF